MSDFRPQEASKLSLLQQYELGRSLLQTGKVDAAIHEFRGVLEADRSFAAAHVCLAECWERKGRLDDATQEYIAALKIESRNIPAQYSLGNIFLTKNKINEAIRQFMIVLRLDPRHIDARLGIARCLEKKNQPSDALQDYRSIAAAHPECIDAYLSAARCLISLNRAPDAVEEYRKALAYAPDRTDIRRTMIRLMEEQCYIEEAIREYREILAKTPGAVDVRLDMASAMDRGGMVREAMEAYARIMEDDPGNAFAFKKHAALAREREKIDQLTDRYLGHVINRMEKIGEHFREGMKMYLDGCFDEALGEFVTEAATCPTPEAHFGTGSCMVRAGSLLTAVPQYREAVRLKDDFKEAHTMLGILYERHGLLYEASEEYERGLKEALDRIKTGDEIKRDLGTQRADISYKFFHL